MIAIGRFRDLTEAEIATALTYLSADCGREEWVRVGMAIKAEFGASGFDLWNDWSQTAPRKYDAKAARDTWKSIKPSGGVTIATLIHEAQQFGFSLNEATRTPLDPSEIEARAARRRAEERDAEAAEHRRRAQAAARATALWDAATPIDGADHPYLERKGVLAFGLSVGPWHNGEEALLVPMRNEDGHLVSLQAIFANPSPNLGRDKDYLYGGQRRGSFHLIGGKPNGNTPFIAVCEGYATGATIHQATGWFVAVAFDAGNLASVARVMRKAFPLATIVIAADNDQWTDGNPGIHHARQAASSANAVLAVPAFHTLEGKPADFNDLHAIQGLDAVTTQLRGALPDQANDNTLSMDSSVNPFSFPDLSDRMQPLNTWQNLEWMLEQYGIGIRYNVISKDVEVAVPGGDLTSEAAASCALADIISLCGRNRMPKADLGDFIKRIGLKNRFNPVAEFVLSKPWDGVSRLDELAGTLQTAEGYNRDLLRLFLRRWLISAVAAALQPDGFWSKGCLVLQGAQSLGKSAWFKALVPAEQRGLVKVGANIDPTNKDTISSAIGHWMVELGELDGTFRKADIAKLKAFISSDMDLLRKPYDRLETRYQRRTVFFASVNPSDFLSDDTGNVRWWTVPVVGVDYSHGIDMQQLWAEVAVMYRSGERWWLEADEEAELEAVNEQHQAVDPVEELIRSRFNWSAPAGAFQPMTATDVLLAIGYDKPTKAQAIQATKALQRITGSKPRDTTHGGKRGKFFMVGSPDRHPY